MVRNKSSLVNYIFYSFAFVVFSLVILLYRYNIPHLVFMPSHKKEPPRLSIRLYYIQFYKLVYETLKWKSELRTKCMHSNRLYTDRLNSQNRGYTIGY
jgi:hypothetical protein